MKNKKTLWLTVIEHIRSVGAGNNITRQQLLNNAKSAGFLLRGDNKGLTTVDTYRGILRNAGYLKTVSRGIYEIVKFTHPCETIKDTKERGNFLAKQILKSRLENQG